MPEHFPEVDFDKLPIEMPLPGCICCDQHNFEYLDAAGERGTHSATLCGRNAVQIGRSGASRGR